MTKYHLARLITALLFTAIIGAVWDVWWHSSMRTDSFWIEPHLLIYSSLFLTLVFGLGGWYTFREAAWKRLAIALSFILFAGPFDEMWHRTFGLELLSNPFFVWSPPHLILIVASITSMGFLLPILKTDPDKDAVRIFGALAFSGMLVLLFTMLAIPIQPFGSFSVIGPAGAGILAAILAAIFLSAKRWMPGIGAASMVAVLFLLINAIFTPGRLSTGIALEAYQRDIHGIIPVWLHIFSVLIPAAVIDLVDGKNPHYYILQGALIGGLWAVILNGWIWYLLQAPFGATTDELILGTVVSVLGGAAGGLLVKIYHKKL